MSNQDLDNFWPDPSLSVIVGRNCALLTHSGREQYCGEAGNLNFFSRAPNLGDPSVYQARPAIPSGRLRDGILGPGTCRGRPGLAGPCGPVIPKSARNGNDSSKCRLGFGVRSPYLRALVRLPQISAGFAG